jgi:hypothetical protein
MIEIIMPMAAEMRVEAETIGRKQEPKSGLRQVRGGRPGRGPPDQEQVAVVHNPPESGFERCQQTRAGQARATL